MKLKVGVVGATGLVGRTFLRLMETRKFPVAELRPFASEKRDGEALSCQGRSWPLRKLQEGCFQGLDLVFFSSGDDISTVWAPVARAAGALVIDNSAAFRLHPEVPLVVPEVNGDLLPGPGEPTIIANPNCSTIQLVTVLAPLAHAFGLKAVRVATYQAVSGAGLAAQDELLRQLQPPPSDQDSSQSQGGTGSVFPHTIAFNCLPQIGSFGPDGLCSEETKIRLETKKILRQPELPVSPFTVRVPVWNGHSEAVWITLEREVDLAAVRSTLENAAGVQVLDSDLSNAYPHPRQASGTEPVWVGRIHADPDFARTWIVWIVADNLMKGAALNGIQIAEAVLAKSGVHVVS